MGKFQIEVVQTVVHTKWVTVEGDDIKTSTHAKLYVSKALENISFEDILKVDKQEREDIVEIEGEDAGFWLDYRGVENNG